MKKVLLALICLTVTLSLLILPVIASTSGAFVASRSTVGRGDTFTVTVSINGAEGVGSIGIIPEYDKTAFEFVSGRWLIEGALSEADISKTGAALFAFDGKENVNGDVYSFTLKVKSGANYGSYSISGTVDAEGNIPASTATVKVAEPGVGIVGQLTSYNPNNAATVQLLQNGEVVYTTTVAATEGTGLKTQNFEFVDILPGVYDLVITKAGHLSATVNGITVADATVDLTAHANPVISNLTLVAGDANADGCIDIKDLMLLTSSDTYSLSYEEAVTKAADINGDKCFDLGDLMIITASRRWESDLYGHWKTCTSCNTQIDHEEHVPGPEADEYIAQYCTVCDYMMAAQTSTYTITTVASGRMISSTTGTPAPAVKRSIFPSTNGTSPG